MNKLIKRQQVEERTGIGRAYLYRLMSEGRFPRPVRVGTRAVRWLESDIQEWIEARVAEQQAGSDVWQPSQSCDLNGTASSR